MTAPAAPAKPARDVVIDAARAFSIVVVVCFHGTLLEASLTPSGGIDLVVLSPGPFGWAASWLVMVLPLFFVCGGYANSLAVRRTSESGGSMVGLLAKRARRLLAPLALSCGLGAVAASAMHRAGSERLAHLTGTNLSRLYWFLAVYLAVVLLAPAAVRLHQRFGLWVLAALAGASLAIGALSPWLSTIVGRYGLDPRMMQVLVVWPLCHQLGIAHQHGFLRTSRPAAIGAVVTGAAVCAVGVALGWFPQAAVGFGDTDGNVTPPTLAMAALALAQLGVMTLLRPLAGALSSSRVVMAAVTALNLLAMTIYLWQVPAIGGAIGIGWLLARAGIGWALSPVVVIALTWVLLALAAPWIARVEDWLAPEIMRLREPWVVAGTLLGLVGTWTVWRRGMTVSAATPLQTIGVAEILVGTALLAVGCGGWGTSRAPRRGAADVS